MNRKVIAVSVISFLLALIGWLCGFLIPPQGTAEHDVTLNIVFLIIAVVASCALLAAVAVGIAVKLRISRKEKTEDNPL